MKTGKNCRISPFARFYGEDNIEIGDNVRIDDFCILSAGEGGIKIGSNIHIACYVSITGAARITLEDFSQIGAKSSLFSSTDDFTGEYLVGPCVPNDLRNVRSSPITLEKYAVLGCNVVVVPGVTIAEGSAIGAMSLVLRSTEPNKLYAGIPVLPIRSMRNRSDEFIEQQRIWYEEPA